MEGIEAVCFQIISFAGSAKSCYMEAIGAAEQDDYDKAKALMAEGDSCFHEGHRIHAQLITKEANQEKNRYSLAFDSCGRSDDGSRNRADLS